MVVVPSFPPGSFSGSIHSWAGSSFSRGGPIDGILAETTMAHVKTNKRTEACLSPLRVGIDERRRGGRGRRGKGSIG